MKLFSEEQINFILENYIGVGNKELTKKVNQEFESSFSIEQIKTFKSYRKLNSGITSEFKKGNVPYNKGMKRGSFGNMKKTQFKKGQKPLNKREVGSERVSPDGYTQIKVANPSKWMAKHKYLFEKNVRKLNKGEIVIFLNGDKTDFDLDNLAAVTRGELAQLNKLGYIQSDRELAIAGLNIIRIKDKLKGDEV
ncbi:HNH endonuclease signature motif containing protein [Vagococcus fluvialis]|uniref:HNH endonuclease signature motif containing protein n=1 Tax=Vagococcus fluvialis TaxID=2738 RepID=UPI00378F5FCF